MTVSPLVRAVTAYTARVLPELLDLGPATSALAPWMLAALVAPGVEPLARAAIERELHLPASTAAAEVGTLFGGGPVALRSAIALWRSAVLATDGAFGAWERGVPAGAATGPIPHQADADAWTDRSTLGLVRRFPVTVTPEMACMLAAAIAARIRWDQPLGVGAAPENAWGLGRMLCAGSRGVYATDLGHVAVASAGSWAERLAVYSFIGPPDTARADLVRAALRLAGAWHGEGSTPEWAWPVPPEELPETGHAWTSEIGWGDGGAMVPAFAEESQAVDIVSLPAIREAAAGLGRLVADALPPHLRPVEVEARLSAVARYDRLGFEAAAVASMGVQAGAMPGERRILNLRFGRPHLALAVATDDVYAGLPLFAAWVDAGVREPDEAGA